MPTDFTPISAIAGGLLIGAAILVLFHTLGRGLRLPDGLCRPHHFLGA